MSSFLGFDGLGSALGLIATFLGYILLRLHMITGDIEEEAFSDFSTLSKRLTVGEYQDVREELKKSQITRFLLYLDSSITLLVVTLVLLIYNTGNGFITKSLASLFATINHLLLTFVSLNFIVIELRYGNPFWFLTLIYENYEKFDDWKESRETKKEA